MNSGSPAGNEFDWFDWFLGSAWEPISRGSASRGEGEIGGRASGSALPGRAWEQVI